MQISDLFKNYHNEIDSLDFELIIAHALKKPREFVLAHPERKLTDSQKMRIEGLAARRALQEPLAHILGHKEFFGLDFKVTKDTLIPRPETELLVELALAELQSKNQKPETAILDIGTGSGNIIISVFKNIHVHAEFFAVDISKKALTVARQNAKNHKINSIKFLNDSLLEPILKNKRFLTGNSELIILANLPYLSKEIYSATAPDVKNYEPKSALVSGADGLDHNKKLLKQIRTITKNYKLKTTNYLEISPEQKPRLQKMVKSILPGSKVVFYKDLARKWRVCEIKT